MCTNFCKHSGQFLDSRMPRNMAAPRTMTDATLNVVRPVALMKSVTSSAALRMRRALFLRR